jgi:hypothetical protein
MVNLETECRNVCPNYLYYKQVANSQTGTWTCVQACQAADFIYKDTTETVTDWQRYCINDTERNNKKWFLNGQSEKEIVTACSVSTDIVTISPNDTVNQAYPLLKYTRRTTKECQVDCAVPDVYNESEYDCLEKCDPAIPKRYRATDLPVCRTSCNLSGPESYYLTDDGEFVCIVSCSATISNTRANSGTTFLNRIFTQITDDAGIHSLVTNAPTLDLTTLHKKCTASCPYAWEDIGGVKVCVDECSPNKFLSK